MDGLRYRDAIEAANSGKRKDFRYSIEDLKENSAKLDEKKVTRRQLLSRKDVYLLTGGLVLTFLLAGVAYSLSEEDLVRKKGGSIHIDNAGFSSTVMPEGIEKPKPKDVIKNLIDILGEGFTKGR
jgi:hypothetical protein